MLEVHDVGGEVVYLGVGVDDLDLLCDLHAQFLVGDFGGLQLDGFGDDGGCGGEGLGLEEEDVAGAGCIVGMIHFYENL